MKFSKICLLSLITLLSVGFALAQTSGEAEKGLKDAKDAIQEMESKNLSTQEVKDIYRRANRSYQNQLALNRSKRPTDYSTVIELTNSITEIRDEAIRVKDKLVVLESQLKQAQKDSNANLTEAEQSFKTTEEEFEAGRYEEAEEGIENTYTKISEARSAATQAQTLYESRQDELKQFFEENYLEVIVGLLIILILSYVGHRELRIYKLKKKKEQLRLRRNVLQELTGETQRKYFEKGEISKTVFESRTDKYSDMIREIEEELPVLDEKLEDSRAISDMLPFK